MPEPVSCETCEISKNTFFHRTSLVVAPEWLMLGIINYLVYTCQSCVLCLKWTRVSEQVKQKHID